jgi:hypothetical protein
LPALPTLISSPRRAAFIAATVSALGLSGSNGKAFFGRDAHQQQAKGIGNSEPDFLQGCRGFPFGASIDTGANNRIASHCVILLLCSPNIANLLVRKVERRPQRWLAEPETPTLPLPYLVPFQSSSSAKTMQASCG